MPINASSENVSFCENFQKIIRLDQLEAIGKSCASVRGAPGKLGVFGSLVFKTVQEVSDGSAVSNGMESFEHPMSVVCSNNREEKASLWR